MQQTTNALGQPLGFPVPNWQPPPLPAREAMEGRFCRLEPLRPERHAESLYAANSLDTAGRMWTYLPTGPYENLESYRAWMEQVSEGADPLFFAIVHRETERAGGIASYLRIDEKEQAVGIASYLRIDPRNGSIEVGHLAYSPLLQQTPAATEAMYLMMAYAFQRGYRRYEWKCNALNAPSRMAAQRLGFSFEGVFRQATIVKGHNRDTAWYSILDSEWPELQAAFTRWLEPANFDAEGKQRLRLSDLTAPILKQRG